MSGALAAPRVSVEMAQLPRAARAVSFADVGDPIPLTWIVRSGVVIGAVLIGAIALSIGAHCRGDDSAMHGTAGSAVGSGSTPAVGRTSRELPAPPAPRAHVDPPVKSATVDPSPIEGAAASRAPAVPGRPAVAPAKPGGALGKTGGSAGLFRKPASR
jgi:hypothetical protein